MKAVIVQVASKVAGIALVLSMTFFPVWLAIAWFSIKMRLNVAADREPEMGIFLLAIVAPYAIFMALLFVGWRALRNADDRINGSPWRER